jgi:peptidyl-prolyl cis-trans isomerase C
MFTRKLFLSILVIVFLSACNGQASPAPTLTPALAPTETLLPPTPSPTPEPLAARVNGEGILLADYQAELGRFQAALTETGKTASDAEARQRVLDALIDEALLAQAAAANGHQVSDDEAQASRAATLEKIGGDAAWAAWLQKNGYTEESYRQALIRSLAAAWQRDQILAAVPTSVEQVHARQILVLSKATADSIYNNLQSGADFATLAQQYDPATGGELGWFPRGYLTQPAVEEAAFALQPGQFSPVVQSDIGFHIVLVVEREVRRLSTDALLTLQRSALADWLQQQRAASQIEILVP